MADRFSEFKELKNIDKTTMISVLEESFRSVLAKMFGSDENFDVIMNPDKGDCEIYQNLEVVPDGEVEDPTKTTPTPIVKWAKTILAKSILRNLAVVPS